VFDAVEDRFGHLDVVVHTAGINRPAALTDLDLADFDEIHRVNVRGTFVVDQQAARRVRAGGSIVNVSSSMVRVAPPALSAYAASSCTWGARFAATTRCRFDRRDRSRADPRDLPPAGARTALVFAAGPRAVPSCVRP